MERTSRQKQSQNVPSHFCYYEALFEDITESSFEGLPEQLFKVSTDFLLGITCTRIISLFKANIDMLPLLSDLLFFLGCSYHNMMFTFLESNMNHSD